MKKNLVWISFDLGIRGDYQGMYSWLDSHLATECGDGLACVRYSYHGDLVDEITKDLKANVQLDEKRSRIYLIHLVDKKMKGRFIIGKRRSAPWVGAGATADQEEDVGA